MKSKYLDTTFPYPSQEEMLQGMNIRREFLIKNNPANILKRQAEIDEGQDGGVDDSDYWSEKQRNV